MPTADGKFKGIAITGRAAATWERIFAPRDEPVKLADARLRDKPPRPCDDAAHGSDR